FVRQYDGRSEFSDLVVSAETKGIAHLVEYANVADIALEVSRIPLGQRHPLGFRSSKQETSVATHELASEVEIVGQPLERISRIARKAGVLTLLPYPKFLHVVLVTNRMQTEMVTHKTEALADVKLQSPISSDKLSVGERSSGTASRFTKHES